MQCMIGAMSTGAAATGTRSWLATQQFSWLTPKRMKMVTASLLGAALLASSFVVSGSTPKVVGASAAGAAHATPALHAAAQSPRSR